LHLHFLKKVSSHGVMEVWFRSFPWCDKFWNMDLYTC